MIMVACVFRGVNTDSWHVNRDSGDVNNPNRDERGGWTRG